AALAAMEIDDDSDALAALLAAQPGGVDLARFATARNLPPDGADALWGRAAMVRLGRPGAETGIAEPRWQALADETLAALADWHARNPDRFGPAENALRLALEKPPPPALFEELVAWLAARGAVESANRQLRLPSHRPVMAD